MGFDDPNNAAAAQVGLKDFDALVDNAAKETSDLNVRYERYAGAQAWLEDSSLFMPLMVNKGAAPMVARLTPFSGAYLKWDLRVLTDTSSTLSLKKMLSLRKLW